MGYYFGYDSDGVKQDGPEWGEGVDGFCASTLEEMAGHTGGYYARSPRW